MTPISFEQAAKLLRPGYVPQALRNHAYPFEADDVVVGYWCQRERHQDCFSNEYPDQRCECTCHESGGAA